MPQVTAPDGTILTIPDDASPELKAAYAKKFESMKPSGLWEGIKEVGRATHSAVTGAATGLGGLFGDAVVGGADLAGQLALGTKEGEFKPRMAPSEALRQITGGDLVSKPKTTPGKYAAAVGEGALSSVLSPGSLAKNMIIGGTSGGGSELAANLFGDNMLTRLLGGLAGGGAAGLATAPKTNAREMAKSALQGVDDVELTLAKDRMVEAMKQGKQINVSQAMGRDSNLDKLVDVLANSKEGTKTVNLLRNQPAHAVEALGQFQNKLPGTIRSDFNMANQVQSAATNRLQALGKERKAVWETTFDETAAAQNIPASKALEEAKANLRNVLQQQKERAAADAEAAAKRSAYDVPGISAPSGDFSRVPSPGRTLRDSAQQGEAIIRLVQTREGLQNPVQLLDARGLPIPRDIPAVKAPPVPETAPYLQGAVDEAKKGVQTASRNLTELTQLPEQAVASAQASILRKAAKTPNTPQAAFLQQLAGKLQLADGTLITDAKQINEILKAESRSLTQPTLGSYTMDPHNTKYLGGIIEGTKTQLGEALAPYKTANKAYQNFTETTINPVKEGPIGALAGPKGSLEGKAAAKGKLEAIFNKGSNEDASGVSDILTVAKQLKASGEGTTFLDGAKTWLSNKVQDSIKTTGERGNDDIAAVLHKAFFETGKQKQGFRDTMAGVADIQGVPQKSLVDGAEQFFNYLGQLSRRPSSVGGIGGQDFRRLAEDSLFGKLGQVSVVTPLRQPVLKYVDWLRSNSYKAMDDLVNTPEGIDMLQKLAKSSTIGPVQATAMATFLSTASQMDNAQVPKE